MTGVKEKYQYLVRFNDLSPVFKIIKTLFISTMEVYAIHGLETAR